MEKRLALAKTKSNRRKHATSRLRDIHLQMPATKFSQTMHLDVIGTENGVREISAERFQQVKEIQNRNQFLAARTRRTIGRHILLRLDHQFVQRNPDVIRIGARRQFLDSARIVLNLGGLFQAFTKFVNLVGRKRETRRIRMAAPAVKKIPGFKKGLVPVETGYRTRTRMGHAVGNRKHCRRTVILLRKLCRNNSNNANMPVVSCNHKNRRKLIAILRLDLFQSHIGDFGFLLLALAVPFLEFRHKRIGGSHVRAQQQLQRRIGAFHSARRIQERRELVHDIDTAHTSVAFHEVAVHFLQARPAAAFNRLKSRLGKGAVLWRHLDQIGKRSQCHQVQELFRFRHAEPRIQGTNKFVRNTDTAKFRIRISITFLMRVKQDIAFGKSFARGLMVVNDQHRHTKLFRQGNFCVRRNTRIDRDDIPRTSAMHFFNRRHRKTITVTKAIRETPIRLDSQFG